MSCIVRQLNLELQSHFIQNIIRVSFMQPFVR